MCIKKNRLGIEVQEKRKKLEQTEMLLTAPSISNDEVLNLEN